MWLTLSWTGLLVGVLLLGVVAILVRYKTASNVLQPLCLFYAIYYCRPQKGTVYTDSMNLLVALTSVFRKLHIVERLACLAFSTCRLPQSRGITVARSAFSFWDGMVQGSKLQTSVGCNSQSDLLP